METIGGSPPLRVEVLGPLRLIVGGTVVEVRGPKRRAVLALLALAGDRAVSVDHLLDALWPDDVPESGRQALHSHVSRLRGHLGRAAARLETLDGGYRLTLGDGGLDVAVARALLARGRAHAADDPAAAAALLREAHALWRGPVLADLTGVAPVVNAAVELEQLHRDVTDALIGCAVAAGRTDPGQVDGVVGIATAAVAVEPLREPAVLSLMRALAVTGRPADALRAGREYRHRLAEEVGLDPSPALGELERDIARGDSGPAAAAPVRAAAPARRASRLIGREGQVGALHRLLAGERLVTLVGPGGVGKTSVALEVARDVEATVLLLAPVVDAGSIPHALAAALALQVVQGDVLTACTAVLRSEPTVLVVDNCEHLLDAVRDTVAVLLDSCPELTVLTTSREPLGLAPERVSRLAPLPVPAGQPDDGDALRRVPSVAIFLDRAGRVRPDLDPDAADLRLVADIVRRLDGLPLAIELAAGRLSTFSLPELHQRLDRSLDLLGGGRTSADARHRTLRATVEWSYQLLTSDERALFRHLSVFPDGVDLVTAEGVAADLRLADDPGGVLARLVDASMIEPAPVGDHTRYRMLETLRAFGLDRLTAAGEDAVADARLLRWAVALTTRIDEDLTTDREPAADATLRREWGNLRAAWHLARGRDTLDDATAIVQSLFDAVFNRDLVEARGWAEELAVDPALADHPRAAAVLGTAAYAAYLRGDQTTADRLARTGLDLAGGRPESSYCRHAAAVAALARGAYDEAVQHSLLGERTGPHPRHGFLGLAALASTYAGDLDAARSLHERAVPAAAGSPSTRGWVEYYGGEIENAAGRAAEAEEHYVRAIALSRTSGATFLLGVANVGLLSVRATGGRVHEALSGYREVIDHWAAAGNWTHQWTTLRNLADLLRRLGDDEPATLLDAAADLAPDAPAVVHPDAATPRPANPGPGRTQALDVARRAIARHLGRP